MKQSGYNQYTKSIMFTYTINKLHTCILWVSTDIIQNEVLFKIETQIWTIHEYILNRFIET